MHFLVDLPPHAQQEAEALISLLQEKGTDIEGGRLTSHGDGLFELCGRDVRIFYKLSSNNRLILLQGLLPDQGGEFLDNIRRKGGLL